MLDPEQYRLLNRASAPWLTLWLIVDFEGGRAHAVGGQGGGSYTLSDGSTGWYATSTAGMTASPRIGDPPDVTVTWQEARRWVASLPAAVVQKAAALRAEGHTRQAAYPNHYPSIGRPYCWDQQCSTHDCEQCAQDRADLAVAQQRRDVEREAWHLEQRAHDRRVRAFLAALAPDDEPTDLLALLEQQATSSGAPA